MLPLSQRNSPMERFLTANNKAASVLVFFIVLLISACQKKMDVINDLSPLSQKRIEVTEIKEWVYTMLPTLVDQPTLLYARAEQSTINGNHFVRIPTKGKGSDKGSFYFKRRPDGSMEVNYVVQLVSDSIKGNGIVGFANLDEKSFRVNVYENNKLVLSKIVPDSLGLFNKVFLSSATQIKKFDGADGACEVEQVTLIKLPNGSDSVIIVKSLGDPRHRLDCPSSEGKKDSFWDRFLKWLNGIGEWFNGGGGGGGGGGSYSPFNPPSGSPIYGIDFWSFFGSGYFNTGPGGGFGVGIGGGGGFGGGGGSSQYGPANPWGPFPIPPGMVGVILNSPVFDPNNPWDDIDNYYEFPEIPIIENGISISDNVGPLNNPKKIGFFDRKNSKDMEHGTSGDLSVLGRHQSLDSDPTWAHFARMRLLVFMTTLPSASREMIDKFFPFTLQNMTIATLSFPQLDWSLSQVGREMVNRFESRVGGEFENPKLNEKVFESHKFKNFLKDYGLALSKKLRAVGGKIDLVDNFDIKDFHPAFNTPYDKFHGLMILINDTETGEILGDNFTIDAQGNWSIDLSITITDHFGIDDDDVIEFRDKNPGFPSWWILQKRRDYVPFKTVIKIKKHIWGNTSVRLN